MFFDPATPGKNYIVKKTRLSLKIISIFIEVE
jgi:hypothetical protein